MWKEIVNKDDIIRFMDTIMYFHDSCIKELKYESGAYIDDELSMYPVNDKRILSILIQRQHYEMNIIEMQFIGLKYFKLIPVTEEYTCEILGARMFIKDKCVYWCDCEDLSEREVDNYEGTLICASKLRWRVISKKIGNEEFYVAKE